MKKYIYPTIISCFLSFFVINTTANDKQNINNYENKYFKNIDDYRDFQDKLLSLYYNYRIIGEVVDPYGNLLTNINVLSSKSNNIMSNSFKREKFLLKDGKFDFFSDGVFSWGLTFEKSKYYKIVVGMGITNVLKSLENGEATLEGRTITKKVKIVLYPFGEINDNLLSIRYSNLSYSRNDEKQNIVGVIIPYMDKYNNIKSQEKSSFSFTDEEALPKELIYIAPGRNVDGVLDGTIRLKTNIPDSGFIQVAYKGQHFFRSMIDAPKDGYTPELIIKEDFNARNTKVKFIVFYFRAMGRYGKGLIMVGDHMSKLSENEVTLNVYLYVNRFPDNRNTNSWLSTNW